MLRLFANAYVNNKKCINSVLSVVFLWKSMKPPLLLPLPLLLMLLLRSRARCHHEEKSQHGCYLQHLSFFCFGFDTFDFLFVVSTRRRCNRLFFFFFLLQSSVAPFPFNDSLDGCRCCCCCCCCYLHAHFYCARSSNSFVFHVGFCSLFFLHIYFLHLLFCFRILQEKESARSFHIQDLNMLSMMRQSKVPFIGVSCSFAVCTMYDVRTYTLHICLEIRLKDDRCMFACTQSERVKCEEKMGKKKELKFINKFMEMRSTERQ